MNLTEHLKICQLLNFRLKNGGEEDSLFFFSLQKKTNCGWSVSEAISRRRLLVIVVVRWRRGGGGGGEGRRGSSPGVHAAAVAHGLNLSCSSSLLYPSWPSSSCSFHPSLLSAVREELVVVVGGAGWRRRRRRRRGEWLSGKGVKCVYMCVFVCTAEGGVDMMRLQCCRDGLAEWLWGVCSLVFEHTANSLYTLPPPPPPPPPPPRLSLQIFTAPSQYLSPILFFFSGFSFLSLPH